MTVQEQRAYVEARIPGALLEDHRQCCGITAPFRVRFVGMSESTGWTDTEDEAWICAYQRVVAREREIAELEEEIGFVTYYLEETEHAVWKRLRERLIALLEEQRKGFRRESEAKEKQP